MSLHLRLPTNRTVSGPKLTMEAGRLTVEYDWEADDGSITWGCLTFEEVLSFRFWDGVSGPAENVLIDNDVRVLDKSDYLEQIKGRWNESVGWQEWQKDQGGSDRFRHFTIYFDDAGSLDVVAARCDGDR